MLAPGHAGMTSYVSRNRRALTLQISVNDYDPRRAADKGRVVSHRNLIHTVIACTHADPLPTSSIQRLGVIKAILQSFSTTAAGLGVPIRVGVVPICPRFGQPIFPATVNSTLVLIWWTASFLIGINQPRLIPNHSLHVSVARQVLQVLAKA